MEKIVIENVYDQITSAAGANTPVYLIMLPNQELLKNTSVTYRLTTINVENTYAGKELEHTYSLTINVNHPDNAVLLVDLGNAIKAKIYKLVDINPKFSLVDFTGDDLIFQSELNVYSHILQFTLKYSPN